METIKCPYCDIGIDIEHDDEYGYDDSTKHQYECPACDNVFVFTPSVSIYINPQKADCLNDGKHDYKMTNTFPSESTPCGAN